MAGFLRFNGSPSSAGLRRTAPAASHGVGGQAAVPSRRATPIQVAFAWLLRRAPNILLIPGTSSVAHLQENLAAAELDLPDDAVAALDGISASADIRTAATARAAAEA